MHNSRSLWKSVVQITGGIDVHYTLHEQQATIFFTYIFMVHKAAMLQFLCENSTTVLGLVVAVLLICYVASLPGLRNMPPGPFPLPLLGNFLMLMTPGVTPLGLFRDLGRKYGKIFTFQMGSKYFVVINDLRLIQEAFVKNSDAVSKRPSDLHVLKQVGKHVGLGVTLLNGQPWKELRRISLMAMRDLGVGKRSLEEKIQDEISAVLHVIDQAKGQPIWFKPLLVKATSNVICNIMFGSRFDYDNPKFTRLLHYVGEALKVNPIVVPVNFFPFLKYFFKPERGFIKTMGTTDAYVQELLADHEETFDPENIRDFVDLILQMRTTNPVLNMQPVVVDIFTAGSETTALTLEWLMVYVAKYPEIQARCQREIDEVLGKGRRVTLADKPKLTFTEATILEVLRLRPAAPFGFPHEAESDFKIQGYQIPKGSLVFSNIMSINSDPVYFKDPETFNPSRWLDTDGEITGRDHLLTFSVGPRACLGEIVAKMQLTMFFVSILQFYTVLPEHEVAEIDLNPVVGFTSRVRDTKLVLKKR